MVKFKGRQFVRLSFWSSILGILALILDFGFTQSSHTQHLLDGFYFFVLALGIVSTIVRYKSRYRFIKRSVYFFDILSIAFTLWLFYMYLFVGVPFRTDLMLENPNWVRLAVLMTFVREFSDMSLNYKRAALKPAQLFVISFLGIILLGSALLMLPNSTYRGISAIDAIFTSTSAVCVTGLVVVDTGTYFTEFGQYIILFLIQIGGLGILTFASYFSYFFKGGSTYENQLALSDMGSSNKLAEVFSTLKYVIFITLTVELFSAFLIYGSVDASMFESRYEQMFFAGFHAVSAFCNAGFSTLTNSLYESGFRYNYYLQLAIIFTFVLGGLGFPIVANIVNYAKYRIRKFVFGKRGKAGYRPWVLNINSRITLITTLVISAVAFVLFLVLEYNNALADHRGVGKLVSALFGATTPRTAGFNQVDLTAMLLPTTMLTFLLMWIGASPASTGGGIKTSTFAIATLNIISLAKGKTRIEIFRREIADLSVRRAFAIIGLSLIVVGTGIVCMAVTDSDKDLLHIAFECFSAFGTVGLSLGITSGLSDLGKLIIIATMFVGRVGMLTILIAFIKRVVHKNYRYPTEEILIN